MSRINLNHAKQAYNVISSWLGDGGKPVTKEVAEARAEVCLGCPRNNTSVSWWDLLVSPIARLVGKQIEARNKMNLSVKDEDKLGTCDVCRCVLTLKIYVPIKFVKENLDQETIKQMPANCWQIQETKE